MSFLFFQSFCCRCMILLAFVKPISIRHCESFRCFACGQANLWRLHPSHFQTNKRTDDLQLSRENSLFEWGSTVCPSYPPCKGKEFLFKCDNAVCPSYPPRKGKCDNAVCPLYPPCKSTEFFYSRVITSVFRYVHPAKASAITLSVRCIRLAKARVFLFGAIRGVSPLRHVRLLREWSLLFSCDSVCAVPPISGGDLRPVRRASRAGDR